MRHGGLAESERQRAWLAPFMFLQPVQPIETLLNGISMRHVFVLTVFGVF